MAGGSAKPGKVIGSVIPYENCGIAEGYDSRMFTIMSSQYDDSIYSYPWRSSDVKVQQDEKEEVAVGSNLMQSSQYAGTGARKVAASHSEMARWL
jgi:mitogen-activated protein kinase 1/3